jgi:hypothetical protein
MSPEPTIVRAEITYSGLFSPIPGAAARVFADLDDGERVFLFGYYTDELSFTEEEFIGLTEREARRLHFDRDLAYLRR